MTLSMFVAFLIMAALAFAGVCAIALVVRRTREGERRLKTSTFHCLKCDSVYTSQAENLTAACPNCGYKNTKLRF